jgi:hypothetical protein
LAAGLFFVALGAYAVVLSRGNIEHRALLTMDERLAAGWTVTVKQVAETAQAVVAENDDGHCRSTYLRPAVAVVLYDLNRYNQAADYNAWAAAHLNAEQILGTALRCLPSDGNLWLRKALLARAAAENPAEIKAIMTLSSQLAPYERRQILARLELWKHLSSYGLFVNNDLARADIRSVLLFADGPARKSLMKGMSPDFKTLVSREATADIIPEEQQP